MGNFSTDGKVERITTPPPDPQIIKKHVDDALLNKLVASRFVGGIVCSGIGAYITADQNFTGLGTYSIGWVALACFLVSFFTMSERFAFVALGILIGKFFF